MFNWNSPRKIIFIKTSIVVLAILTTCLSLAACKDSPAQPQRTITPNATVVPATSDSTPVTITPTAKHPTPPKNTPTPFPSPTQTFVPLPALFEDQLPLGINWGIDAFAAQYVPATNTGAPVLVHQRYGTGRTIEVVDTWTGQTLFSLPTEQDKYYEQDSTINSLYILIYDDGDPNILTQSYDIRNGELLWQVTTEQATRSNEVIAFEDGVLLMGHQYGSGPTNTFSFLDVSNGQLLWQQTPDMECYVNKFQVHRINNQLHVFCDEQVWVFAINNGEVVTVLDMDPGSIYDLTIANQTVFWIRSGWEEVKETGHTYQVEKHYLEARDIFTYDTIWVLPIAGDVHDLAAFNGDVIYRSHNQVFRLNGTNGNTIWQTTVAGNVPSNLLLQNQWLFLGSRVGYLHLLNAETGEIVWEQDLWATIEPRSVYVSPVALLDDAIIVFYGGSHLSLGNSDHNVWLAPTSTPNLTPTTVPTSTPIPVFTIPAEPELPTAPEAYEIWPQFIAAFLNADPTNVTRLEDLLLKWSDSESSPPGLAFELQTADLNNDDRQEWILVVSGPYMDSPDGWEIIIQQDADDQFNLAWMETAANPEILSITDLNSDKNLDVVFGDVSYGASQSYVTIIPVGWDGQAVVNLALEPIASTNVHLDEVRIEDTTGDNRQEIIIRGGTFGSLAAGPNRTSTFTYGWSENGYVLLLQEPDLPQEYYFFLVEANQHLVAGELEAAISIYEDSFSSEDAIYYYNADHQRAFAEFQLMLAYLLQNDEERAAFWANSDNYPDQLYSQVKQTFWKAYQENRDWTTAAELARKQVRLAGFERAQLIPWVGYANSPLSLEQILPCKDCLQGSIGSEFGP